MKFSVAGSLAAVACALCLSARGEAPEVDKKLVKVFILAGQSNMEGKAKLPLLEYQVKQPATRPLFAHFEKDGKWAEREDVWIKFLDRKGPLTAGYGSPNCIGPELQFGWTVGDQCTEPVLLIKTAWGGRSLWRDFRSPSAGMPPDALLQKMLRFKEAEAVFKKGWREHLDEWNKVGSDWGYHYLGSAKTLCAIGKACAEALGYR